MNLNFDVLLKYLPTVYLFYFFAFNLVSFDLLSKKVLTIVV